GVRAAFPERTHFHEQAFVLPKPAAEVIEQLAEQRIVAGVSLAEEFPELAQSALGDALLVCATETKTAADLERFAAAIAALVG
ncbi:MAG: glycine dehydrogenase, partial [Lysobacteraceae bacterium]